MELDKNLTHVDQTGSHTVTLPQYGVLFPNGDIQWGDPARKNQVMLGEKRMGRLTADQMNSHHRYFLDPDNQPEKMSDQTSAVHMQMRYRGHLLKAGVDSEWIMPLRMVKRMIVVVVTDHEDVDFPAPPAS